MKTTPLAFLGMNNRANDTGLPMPDKLNPFGKYRNAVNVDFSDDGKVEFPRMGSTRVYTGTDCHSWIEYSHDYGLGLFVEGTSLKLLNADFTATTLKTVGSGPMSYATINDFIYFSNGTVAGRYKNGSVSEWGVEVPPIQPTATATSSGGMYGGDYLIAITWLTVNGNAYEESGTPESRRVTVADGGGIKLSAFPVPPSTVDAVAVYVSAVNSSDLYLYDLVVDEYPAAVSEVYLRFNHGAIPLTTQFGVKVRPGLGLTVYNGGIFWIEGERVHYTDAHHLGLYRAYQFMHFEHEVLAVVGIPTGPLYVMTVKGVYRVDGVYGEAPPRLTKIKTYGGAKNALFYDDNDNVAYLFTDNGFVLLTAEGLTELHANDVATPHFDKGCLAAVEHNGSRRLIGVFQGGTVNRLQHPDYTATEVARGGTGL